MIEIATCMVFSNKKILLLRRKKSPYKGWLAFLGGKIENSESIIDACKREIAEETGLKINPKFVCTLNENLIHDARVKEQFKLHYHSYTIEDGQSYSLISGEEGEIKWYDINSNLDELVPSDYFILYNYLNGKMISTKLRCELHRLPSNDKKREYDLELKNFSWI